jgi:hypothetical protein
MIFNSVGGKGTCPGAEVIALIHSVRKAVPFMTGKQHDGRNINYFVEAGNCARPQVQSLIMDRLIAITCVLHAR